MPKLRRVEIWSNLQCAGGASLAAIPDIVALTETTKVAGDSELLLTIPVQSPAYAQLLERRVLRVVYVDDTFDEWRILKLEEADEPQKGLLTLVTGAGLTLDLANALCYRTEANGASYPDFEGLQLTPSQHLNSFILAALTAQGQAFWSAGQVDPTAPLDLVYSWDTPLSALKRIAQATNTELAVRRNGTTGYFIDLANQVGSSAASVDVRLGKNIRAIKRLRDTTDIATRVYPRGAAESNLHPTLAGAKWKVTANTGTVLTLADPVNPTGAGPIQYDNQLNGLYLLAPNGTLFQVTASVASTQQVTVTPVLSYSAPATVRTMPRGERYPLPPSQPIMSQPTVLLLAKVYQFRVLPRPPLDTLVPSFYEPPYLPDSLGSVGVGSLVEFRADSLGNDVVSLDSPVQKATYGIKPVVYDRPDIPGTKNVVLNPAMRLWAGGAGTPPDSWVAVGSPTLTKTSTPGFWRVGTQSCKVVSASDGDGLETAYSPVSPTLTKPYFSGFVSFFMTGGGQVRTELWATDGTTTYVFPDGTSGKAFSTQQNAWVDLGVAGIDLNRLKVTQVKMRVVQDGSQACTFYVDSAQVVNEASQLPFFEGYGPTVLWQAANVYLSTHDSPIITVTVDIVDLTREDPTSWPYDTLTLGGPIVLNDSLLNLSVNTRVVELKRNLLVDADSGVTLSNRPEDLTDALVRPRLAQRYDRPVVANVVPRVDAYFTSDPTQPGILYVRLVGSPPGANVNWILLPATSAAPKIGASGFGPYTGTALRFDLTASAIDQVLYAYAQQGNLTSTLSSWRLAAKGSPTVNIALSEAPAAGNLSIAISADPTVASVLVYRKLGGWPTLDATTTGALDDAQFRLRLGVLADAGGWDATGNPVSGGLQSVKLTPESTGWANGNVLDVIVIPIDRWGNPGPRATATLTIGGALSPAIASVDNPSHGGGGIPCTDPNNWDVFGYGCVLNSATLSGDTVDVEVQVNGGAWAFVTTFTLTGPSQHPIGTYSTGCGQSGCGTTVSNQYTFRFTLKRSGVQKDQQQTNIHAGRATQDSGCCNSCGGPM